MTLIIIALAIWGVSALIRSAREKRAREQAQRMAYEQARIKREMREMKQRANEDVAARIALEREQMRQRREQEKERKEREAADAKLAEEQEKIKVRLAKVEAEQRKMRFEINQINEDLPLLHRQLETFMEQMDEWQNKLHKAQLDLEWDELRMREAPSAVKGKEHDAHLKAKATAEAKIISLEKNIRKAEKQIATAEFKKSEYARKLSA